MTTNQTTLTEDDVPTEKFRDYWEFHPSFNDDRHDVPFVLWTEDRDGHIDVWREGHTWQATLRVGGGNPAHGGETTEVVRRAAETKDSLKYTLATLEGVYDDDWRTKLVNMSDTGTGGVTRIDRQTQFGNPYRLEKDGGDYTRVGSVQEYRKWFNAKMDDDEEFREAVHGLVGETLSCWCVPKLCHGHVILNYLHGREFPGEFEE